MPKRVIRKCWYCGGKTTRKTFFKVACKVRTTVDGKIKRVDGTGNEYLACKNCENFFKRLDHGKAWKETDTPLVAMWKLAQSRFRDRKKLEKRLKNAIKKEQYERAARLKELLDNKQGESQ